ncbi:unnamed protein product [Heligmosomoides polygyrus]|uniref:Fucosyltransferase n=1 Tax=Heligmosomoides polygyrus TaxID=6339 RepID=A0A3P8GVN5_HELPZ|nr:unnamed protein product [Heligmosomoides polygyrus]
MLIVVLHLFSCSYHFYLAFENSICKHYITEKLWKHGYTHYVVPIVLKREIVEQFAPPYSFIAADDFRDPADLAKYLKYLMENKTAYLEYFMWRLDYHVVFLDGVHHDKLERPWGLCQHHLEGKRYEDRDHLENDLRAFFASKSPDFYVRGIRGLVERWLRRVNADGVYLVD